MFEEDFFQDKKMEAPTEENTTYLWINKNLQVVIGVCVLVGGTCIIVPICIGICWFCTRNKEKKKDEDFEMDSKKKEEETGKIADRTDEEKTAIGVEMTSLFDTAFTTSAILIFQ